MSAPIIVPVNPPAIIATELHIPVPVPCLLLEGNTVAIDLLFEDGEFCRLYPQTPSGFITVLMLFTDLNSFPGFARGAGYLLDADGNALHSPQTLGSASSFDGRLMVGLFPLLGSELAGLLAPVDFYGVHFDLTLPAQPSAQLVSGEFRLSNGPFGLGPGVPDTLPVPDSGSTLLLLALALAMLNAKCTRLKNKNP